MFQNNEWEYLAAARRLLRLWVSKKGKREGYFLREYYHTFQNNEWGYLATARRLLWCKYRRRGGEGEEEY
jgi:hypothetical protein